MHGTSAAVGRHNETGVLFIINITFPTNTVQIKKKGIFNHRLYFPDSVPSRNTVLYLLHKISRQKIYKYGTL